MLNRRSKIRLITVTNDKLSRKRTVTFFFIAISHIKSLFVAFVPFQKAGGAGGRHNWSTASSSCRPFYLPTYYNVGVVTVVMAAASSLLA